MNAAPSIAPPKTIATYPYLHELMTRYQLTDLVSVSPEAFTRKIYEFLALRDHAMEGFVESTKQADISVNFHWGHHHDFGEYGVPGRMCKHHLSVIKVFIDDLEAMPRSLDGLRVLDIGCWTGGTSLLLCAMGAEVVAIEEVKKYADCVDYLHRAFDIKKLEAKNLSLYDCTTPEFQDSFDLVLCAGVLHYATDPKLALRIMFNCLKDGGKCLIETITTSPERLIEFARQSRGHQGFNRQNDLDWNALLFTPDNLAAMMAEVGFDMVQPCRQIKFKTPLDRLFAVGQRNRHMDFRRTGLSVRNVR